ncbi:MAG: aminotransferase class III-fold pyridoxal phosphate-dependent enzyme, partial [Rhodospirillaceae bacterium]|nr:aminotransferase class III-fold pyridoxal phosphate-dependent enzyme [Rhodospirillaceae bacterium]
EDYASRLAAQLDALIVAEGPETVAAFVAEPVIASGGMIVPPAGYFQKVQVVLRKHDVLMVADEVICSFGRTGHMFGCETLGIVPDLMVVAKQLSSAYIPISGVLMSDAFYEGLKEGGDQFGIVGTGFTYSAHPVAAAVALETLAIYEERDLVSHAATVGAYMREQFSKLLDHPLVGEVRGVGLMAGIELVKDKESHANFAPASKVGAKFSEIAISHGLLIRPLADDTLALSPPLIITQAEIDELLSLVSATIVDFTAWIGAEQPD